MIFYFMIIFIWIILFLIDLLEYRAQTSKYFAAFHEYFSIPAYYCQKTPKRCYSLRLCSD